MRDKERLHISRPYATVQSAGMGGKEKERVDALVRAGAGVVGVIVWWRGRGRRVARLFTKEGRRV